MRNYLIDVLTQVEPFTDVVTHVLMKPIDDDCTLAIRVKAKDGSMAIEATSLDGYPTFTDRACLGSLSFLKSALSIDNMDQGKLFFTFDKSSKPEIICLRSIKMSGEKSYSAFYQAVDPFILNLSRIKQSVADEEQNYDISFGVDQEFIKAFNDMLKIHNRGPKIGKDFDDIFTLAYDDNKIHGLFGEKGHQVSIVLSDITEAVNVNEKRNIKFSIVRFQKILKLLGKSSGVASLSNRGLRLEMATKYNTYKFVITAKRESTT